MDPEFVNKLWLSDFKILKSELEAAYPNLRWKASFESDIDLPALAARAEQSLLAARSEEDAIRIIENFIYDINDGHLYLAQPRNGGAPPSMLSSVHQDAASACAALGYANFDAGAYSMPFERAGQFQLLADARRSDFRTGMVTTPAGQKAAVVRISAFLSDNLVSACEASFERISTPADAAPWPRWCDEECEARLREETIGAAISQLRRDLDRASAMGARTLLIDVGGNDGGEKWAWRLAQSLTDQPIKPPAIGIVADGRLDRLISALSYELRSEGAGPSRMRKANGATAELEALIKRRAEAARAPHCDLSWVWEQKRPWSEASLRECGKLVFLPTEIARKMFPGAPSGAKGRNLPTPVAAAPLWQGPVAILVDRNTASAAELFAGYFQDARAGLIIGERTAGAGCGFIDFESPIILPNTGLQLIAPDCVILRQDGSNAVSGVSPDIEIDVEHGLVNGARRILGAALGAAETAQMRPTR